jgi:uncharacterized peroxidase-related enzyme
MMAHAAALRLRTKDPVLVDLLLANYRQADLHPRDRAMLDFAVKITRDSAACQPTDLERLRDVGYTDDDILHIAELTAIFNYNGVIANAMGLVPNVEYHELGRNVSPRA